MEKLKIYIFNNIMGNYCSGDFYFVATNIKDAKQFSREFATEHNKKVNNNTNYTIEWDEDPKQCDLREGYLSINRVYIPTVKSD